MLEKNKFLSTSNAIQKEKAQAIFVLGLATVGLGNISVLGVAPVLGAVYLPIALMILTVYLAIYFRKAGEQLRYSLILFVTFLAFLPGFLVTELNPYGEKKLLAVAITFLLIVAPSASRIVTLNLALLFKVIIGFSVITSVLVLLFGEPDVAGRAILLGLNPIGTGRVTGIGAVILFVLWATQSVPFRQWWLYLLPSIICILATLETGSRGPLFSIVLGVLIPLLFGKQTVRSRIVRLLIAAGAGLAVAYLLFSPKAEGERVASLDANGRDELYRASFDSMTNRPAGVGWGNFVEVLPNFSRVDTYTVYPHNIFLEIGVEGGWFALASFILLLVFSVVNVIHAIGGGSRQAVVVFAILIFSVINASLSSDFVGNRFMWLAFGLAFITFPVIAPVVEAGKSLSLKKNRLSGK